MKTESKRAGFWKPFTVRLATAVIILCWIISVVEAALELGSCTFLSVSAMSLTGAHFPQALGKASLASGLSSYGFVSAIGGVAFDGVASPKPGYSVVSLRYRAEQPDGKRLEVVLSTGGRQQTVAASVYDWQLKPIADFAGTTDFACFTLFGKLKDAADTEARRKRGEEILNYHPAFENALLGLRLMQADILILRSDACDLVRQDGKWLLGAGEKEPDVKANLQRLARVQRVQDTLPGGPFRSYVICDHGVSVTFGATNRVLALTGNPVWFSWKTKRNDSAGWADAQREANRQGNERLRALPDVGTMDAAERRRRFVEFTDEDFSKAMLQHMPDYSRELSAEIQRDDGINPAVYSALGNTMRYAAFFRHVKKQQPREWEQFIKSLGAIKPAPEVETPTVMIPPAGARLRR